MEDALPHMTRKGGTLANHQTRSHNDGDDALSYRGKCESKNQRLTDTTGGDRASLISAGFARLKANPAGK